MTAEKSTPCSFSAVFRCCGACGGAQWAACLLRLGPTGMDRLGAVLRSRWHGSPACRALVPLAWAAWQPRLALAPWRVRHRLLSGPFSTMAGPCVLNGPFLVAFRACFGPLSTKVGEACKKDHFEWPAWLWRLHLCRRPQPAADRPAIHMPPCPMASAAAAVMFRPGAISPEQRANPHAARPPYFPARYLRRRNAVKYGSVSTEPSRPTLPPHNLIPQSMSG